jgi:hypothetical protein
MGPSGGGLLLAVCIKDDEYVTGGFEDNYGTAKANRKRAKRGQIWAGTKTKDERWYIG